MFTAHAPSGYIAASVLLKKFVARKISSAQCIIVGMIGAIFPDIDLVYFYVFDHRQHPHHSYFTHWPSVWLCMLLVSGVWLRFSKTSHAAALAFLFSIGGMLHMLLDSIVGHIMWLAPFSDRYFSLFTISARYQPWWLNFILHWSFALELLIWFWAIYVYRHRPAQSDNKWA
jgi:hypothetical protein